MQNKTANGVKKLKILSLKFYLKPVDFGAAQRNVCVGLIVVKTMFRRSIVHLTPRFQSISTKILMFSNYSKPRYGDKFNPRRDFDPFRRRMSLRFFFFFSKYRSSLPTPSPQKTDRNVTSDKKFSGLKCPVSRFRLTNFDLTKPPCSTSCF